jgi:hypothetical protein
MQSAVGHDQVDLGDVGKVPIDEGHTDYLPRVVPDGPGLCGPCGLDVLGVGLRTPEPLRDGEQETRHVSRDLPVPLCDPGGVRHALRKGRIESSEWPSESISTSRS